MIKKTFFLLVIVTVYNCNVPQKKDYKEISFNSKDLKSENLKSTEIFNVCDSTSFTVGVLRISDKLILNELHGHGVFHVIDLKSNKYIGIFGNIGSGPGEIAQGPILLKDDNENLQIYDAQQKKVVVFDIKSLKENSGFKKEYILKKLIGSSNTFIIDNNAYSLSYSNPDHRIYISDLEGNLKDSIGTIPAENNNKLNIFAQGHDAKIQFNKNIIALSYVTTPVIQIFNRKNKRWTVTKGPENFPSIFIQKENTNTLAYTKDTKVGYLDVKVNDKYIYALYSGKKLFDDTHYQSKCIYVFNLDGTPFKQYILDKDIVSFDVYNNNIYGLEMKLKKNKLLKFKI